MTAGQTMSPAVVVDVEDQYGNVVASDNSTVTLAVLNASGANNCHYTAAASDGQATFSDISLTAAGTDTLQASDFNRSAGSRRLQQFHGQPDHSDSIAYRARTGPDGGRDHHSCDHCGH